MSIDDAAPLGQRIRHLRKNKHWSARILAEQTNGAITRSIIADLENGRRDDITLTAAIAIAHIFGITVEDLADTKIPAEAISIAAEIVSAKRALQETLRRAP